MRRACTTPSRGAGALEGTRLRLYADRGRPAAARRPRRAHPGAQLRRRAAPRARWPPRDWAGQVAVQRCPDADDPDLLATLRPRPGAHCPRGRGAARRAAGPQHRPPPVHLVAAAGRAAGPPRRAGRRLGSAGRPAGRPRSPPAASTRSCAGPTRSSAATRSTPPRPRAGSRWRGPRGSRRPASRRSTRTGLRCPRATTPVELPDPQGEPRSSSTAWSRCARVDDDRRLVAALRRDAQRAVAGHRAGGPLAAAAEPGGRGARDEGGAARTCSVAWRGRSCWCGWAGRR